MSYITFQFVNCHVRYFPAADYLETVFQDGAKCPAQFTFTLEDYQKAVELGYRGRSGKAKEANIRQMHLEHELSHTFIAEALGEPYCPVLRSVAVKGPCEIAWDREALVLDFQRFLNGVPMDRAWRNDPLMESAADDFERRFRK